ncbi:MAG TPA: dihydrofolate reductase family protein [Myxococcota bacterium]
MRRIVVGAQISIDGVMQSPGGRSEDPTKGFAFGGWAMPYDDDVFGEEIMKLFASYELLLGRKTYEIFAAYWPYYDENADDGGIASSFSRVTKHVVSRSGDVDPTWQGSSLLRGIDEVRRLKEGDGPDLVVQGSTMLVQALFAADLVDRLSLFIVPVVLGGGKRLFVDGATPHAFTLTGSRTSSTGVVIAHYERAGAVKISDALLTSPSDREVARQQRLQREG